MVRYFKRLEEKDFFLVYFMIVFGFCMMKFNVMIEMILIMWLEFVNIYLFVLKD